jgi:hypothetical protein
MLKAISCHQHHSSKFFKLVTAHSVTQTYYSLHNEYMSHVHLVELHSTLDAAALKKLCHLNAGTSVPLFPVISYNGHKPYIDRQHSMQTES